MGNHGSHRRWPTFASRASCCALLLTLLGCPTVDLGDTPTDIGLCNPPGGLPYFEAEIWPRFIRHGTANACTQAGGCHAQGGGNALDFQVDPIDLPANYRQAQVFLNCGTPDKSDLLTKPLAGENPHGGDDLFTSLDDDGARAFLGWFQ